MPKKLFAVLTTVQINLSLAFIFQLTTLFPASRPQSGIPEAERACAFGMA